MTQSKIRWLAVAALLLAACTTVPNEGQVMIDQGNYREGLARYEQAMRERPLDAQVRIRYYDARDQVVLRLLAQAAA